MEEATGPQLDEWLVRVTVPASLSDDAAEAIRGQVEQSLRRWADTEAGRLEVGIRVER